MKVKIKVIKKGFKIDSLGKKARREAIKAGGSVLLQDVIRRASGGRAPSKGVHPYSKSTGNPGKNEKINVQSGKFRSSIRGRLPKEPVDWGPFYYFVESKGVDYAEFLTKGTKVMYARDIFREASLDKNTRQEVFKAALKAARKALK